MNDDINFLVDTLEALGLQPIVIETPGDIEKKLDPIVKQIQRENCMKETQLISCYTRAQAIADGVLVELLQHPTAEYPEIEDLRALVYESGFKYPMAMTAAAFSAAIAPIGGELPAGQDVKGRLWDLLTVLKLAIRASRGLCDRIDFSVSVWDGQHHNKVDLYSLCGPGDHGEPVITIMLPGED